MRIMSLLLYKRMEEEKLQKEKTEKLTDKRFYNMDYDFYYFKEKDFADYLFKLKQELFLFMEDVEEYNKACLIIDKMTGDLFNHS